VVVTEPAVVEERISQTELVSEDDIVGGRVHVMYDRLTRDDWAGALLVAESLIRREPDHQDAWQCLRMCHTELRKLYVSRLGSLTRIPQLCLEPGEMGRRLRDERVAGLLTLVDGLRSLEEVLEAADMAAVEALRLLSELYLSNVLEFEDE